MNPALKNGLIAAAVVAAAAEGFVIYKQWPAPPLKVCASIELGELLAASAKSDAQLSAARGRLRTDPNPATTQEVMQLETESAKALNAVAIYKQQDLARQKASGTPAGGACS